LGLPFSHDPNWDAIHLQAFSNLENGAACQFELMRKNGNPKTQPNPSDLGTKDVRQSE
jgi:hypothetical protein